MKTLVTTIILLLSSVAGIGQQLQVLDLKGSWKFTIGDREEYANPTYEDSAWETIYVPAPWESEGFANYNGYAWYRYTFDGSELSKVNDLTLNLGYIDDVHQVYLNGELLGFKGSFPPDYYTAYNALNNYTIPDKLINKQGKNVIAIKVYDLTQDGGIVKGRDIGIWHTMRARMDQNLAGIWRFTTRKSYDWEMADASDDDWDDILVPSFWRSKNIRWSSFRDSKAWYRKKFYLADELKDQDLILVLGKVDDFDNTYLNGKLIGSTSDGRRFGRSESYNKQRIYRIKKEDLNQNGANVIAVEVIDLGGDAGIYEGPIGLIRANR